MMDPRQLSFSPAYLRGVMTVEGERTAGHTGPDGWLEDAVKAPVLLALSYVAGKACLTAEDGDGGVVKYYIPGGEFLRLVNGAAWMLRHSAGEDRDL